jgi:hypothetical protein
VSLGKVLALRLVLEPVDSDMTLAVCDLHICIEILRVERNGSFGAALALCASMIVAVGFLWRTAVSRVAPLSVSRLRPDKTNATRAPAAPSGRDHRLYPRLSRVARVAWIMKAAPRDGGDTVLRLPKWGAAIRNMHPASHLIRHDPANSARSCGEGGG